MIHHLYRFLKNIKTRLGRNEKATFFRALFILVILVTSCTFGFYFSEKKAFLDSSNRVLTLGDSLWWALTTLTTVGYGDLYPTTLSGRLFGYLAFISTGFLAWCLGEGVSLVVEHRSKKNRGLLPVELSNHIVICHFPGRDKFIEVVTELRADPDDSACPIVMLNDSLETNPFEDPNLFFVRGAPTDLEILKNAGIGSARKILILSPDERDPQSDFQSLGVVLKMEKNFPGVLTVVECVNPANHHLFLDAGAEEVVNISGLTAGLLSQALQGEGIPEIIYNLLSNRIGSRIFSLKIDKGGTVAEMKKNRMTPRTIFLGARVNGVLKLNPDDFLVMEEGDFIYYVGEKRIY